MYNHSSARVKLLHKLSDKIDILWGNVLLFYQWFIRETEQHVRLSLGSTTGRIKSITYLVGRWPRAIGIRLMQPPTHLEPTTRVLYTCTEWGLSVNLEKTAIMTFNKSGRLLKESTGFTYGNTIISPVREYCYLGKTLALNGSFNNVQQKLKTKRSEMIFLKSMIDIRPLKRSVVFKLFDSLVLP